MTFDPWLFFLGTISSNYFSDTYAGMLNNTWLYVQIEFLRGNWKWIYEETGYYKWNITVNTTLPLLSFRKYGRRDKENANAAGWGGVLWNDYHTQEPVVAVVDLWSTQLKSQHKCRIFSSGASPYEELLAINSYMKKENHSLGSMVAGNLWQVSRVPVVGFTSMFIWVELIGYNMKSKRG